MFAMFTARISTGPILIDQKAIYTMQHSYDEHRGGGQRPKRPHTYKKSEKGPRNRGFLGPFGAFDPVFLA